MKTDRIEEGKGEVSMRTVAAHEVGSVISSVFLTLWLIIPLQPPFKWMWGIPGVLALALIVNSHRVRGESLRQLGLSMDDFGRALKLLVLPTLIAIILFVSIGLMTETYQHRQDFSLTLILLPIWGLVQQLILQGFIYRRVRYLLVGDGESGNRSRVNLAIVLTALLFSLAHAPNPALMVLTLAGGLIWSWVYERAPNLPALALSHGLMSGLVITSLPPWILHSMSVGYKHFLYQKF